MMFSIFVSCPKGIEYLLEDELKTLGLQVSRTNPQGVYGEADLECLYRLCLHSRLANRVQLILFDGPAPNQQALYALCRQYSWESVFSPENTLAIEFHGSSNEIRHTLFGAQVIKDAISDYFRESGQSRPNIDRSHAQIRLHAYLKHNQLTVSFDLTGYSLHQRGYRIKAGEAPLKENVAAALLIRAQWPDRMRQGASLYDPVCGSGTIVIEAAMMAANIAPGLLRDDQSLHHWIQHQPLIWARLRETAETHITPPTVHLKGTDIQPQMIRLAKENAQRAGVADWVDFETSALGQFVPTWTTPGIIVANPPYGERLSDMPDLTPVYQQLGQLFNQCSEGSRGVCLTSDESLARAIGLRSNKQYRLYNGALACKVYCFDITEQNTLRQGEERPLSEQAQMFANRLKKNHDHLKKWAKRNDIHCYRIYDADLPEYAYAIDIYHDHAVLQEYLPPASVPEHIARRRSADVLQVAKQVLNLLPEHIVIKTRQRQKGLAQYEKVAQTHEFMQVREGQATLQVNLRDYLDTGLFLDHRPLRLKFATLPKGTRFLNCFCYTATASVHASLAGAITTNVDLSNTYLDWAKENFLLNHLDLSYHQFVQYDCLEWLKRTRDRFDVIFLDPPSFSNSKRMEKTLEIQRDHVELIHDSMRLLNPGGSLYFSTNYRPFKLSETITSTFRVEHITPSTIDLDFKRNPRIHHCFLITNST